MEAGGLPLGTLITRGDEATITEALELYQSLVPENGFFGRGKNLGPKLVLTDDDAEKFLWEQAGRNPFNFSAPSTAC